MNEYKLKVSVGVFLILSHFLVIVLIVALKIRGGFDYEEMTTAIALIIPMFAAYSTAIIKFFIDNKDVPDEEQLSHVRKPFVFVTFLIPALFVSSLISVILLRARRIGISDAQQFKQMLGMIETVFGIYIGLLMRSMFDNYPSTKKQPGKIKSTRTAG